MSEAMRPGPQEIVDHSLNVNAEYDSRAVSEVPLEQQISQDSNTSALETSIRDIEQNNPDSLAFRTGKFIGNLLSKRAVRITTFAGPDNQENSKLQQVSPKESTEYDTVSNKEVNQDSGILRLFNQLTSPEGRAKKLQTIATELEDPQYLHIARLKQRQDELFKELKLSPHWEVQKQKNDTINRIGADIQRLYGNSLERYNVLKQMQDRELINNSNTYFGEEAMSVMQEFLKPEHIQQLPHAGEVFIPSTSLESKSENLVLSCVDKNDVFEIPSASIVSAIGFESWEGRGGIEDAKSKAKIADYAARDTSVPPVHEIYMYILPSGKSVFITGNSHRVAAAIKRGDKTISFSNGIMTVSKLNHTPYQLKHLA